MTVASPVANVDDDTIFVNWGGEPLPHAGDSKNGYEPRTAPTHHWCLLGEIVSKTAADNNTHTLELRDKNGHVQSTMLFAYKRHPSARFYKVGHTVALLYPERFDPQTGLSEHDHHYAESPRMEILDAARKAYIHAPFLPLHNVCQVCRSLKQELILCGWCKMVWYCAKGSCRATDRQNGHHVHCKVLRGMREFLTRDWDTFTGFWRAEDDEQADEPASPKKGAADGKPKALSSPKKAAVNGNSMVPSTPNKGDGDGESIVLSSSNKGAANGVSMVLSSPKRGAAEGALNHTMPSPAPCDGTYDFDTYMSNGAYEIEKTTFLNDYDPLFPDREPLIPLDLM